MNDKTIIELGFRIIWRIASTDNTLHDLHNYWVGGTKFLLSVLCIIECPVQLISEVFWDCISVDTRLPRFEALAYVLPHFDALTRMVIRVSSAFIFQTFAEVYYSVFVSVHLLNVCWIFVKRTYFKSLLKVYYRSVFAESFKTFIFQKFRRPLCHKVNLPRCEARRRRFIMTCDIFGTGQTNILGLCYLFGKTYKQPTVAPLKSLKSTHSTKLLHLLRRTIRYH